MTRALVRRIAALALASALLAPLAPAAEARPAVHVKKTAPTPVTLLARLWAFLAPVSVKNGCTLDPNGSPRCTDSRPPGEEGCTLDPNGTCVQSAPTTEAGCTLDPNGACVKGD